MLALLLPLSCQNNSIDIDSESTSGTSDTDEPTPTPPTPPTTTTTTVGVTTNATLPGTDAGVDVDTGEILDLPDERDTDTFPVPEPYLVAVDTSIAPGLPLQGIAWILSFGDSIDITFQWLSLDQGSTTEPRELIGDVFVYPDIALDDQGGFVWELGELMVPGEANPITGGDLLISASLYAQPAAQPLCGFVEGEVLSPIQIPLDGSTHAMTLVDIDDLPLDFLSACP